MADRGRVPIFVAAAMRFSFLSAFPPFRGGIAQFGAALVSELRKEHDVSTFTFTRQYPELLFPGTSQYDTAAPGETGAARVLDSINPFSWHRTARQMLKGDPDVAVLRYWMPFFAPAMGTVAGFLRKHRVKVVSIVDNAIPHEPHLYDKPLTRWFLGRNDGLIAMTRAVEGDIRELCPKARVHRMPHPLYDHLGAAVPRRDARARLGLAMRARVLLFFGLIRDYKGLDLLIDAFGSLGTDYQLVIAGEPYGPFAQYLEQIKRNPHKDNIHVHARFIADAEVPAFFGAADAVVLPYRSATQSGVTAMAFHFGVPVVATDVGGLNEVLTDGVTGVLVPEVSAPAIAKGVQRLFSLDQEKLGENIARLREELSWKRFAEGLVEFARSL